MKDIIGQKFGKLFVIEEVSRGEKNGYKYRRFRCECDCGGIIIKRYSHLLTKTSKPSCGCKNGLPEEHSRRTKK